MKRSQAVLPPGSVCFTSSPRHVISRVLSWYHLSWNVFAKLFAHVFWSLYDLCDHQLHVPTMTSPPYWWRFRQLKHSRETCARIRHQQWRSSALPQIARHMIEVAAQDRLVQQHWCIKIPHFWRHAQCGGSRRDDALGSLFCQAGVVILVVVQARPACVAPTIGGLVASHADRMLT